MPKQTFFNLPEEKRERILTVAIDEFAEQGYKAASISRIVAAAGIAKGSFYQYFEDKDDLFAHIVTEQIAEQKMSVYEEEKEKLADLSLTEFLRVVFQRQREEFQKQPQLLRLALGLMQITSEPIYQRIMQRYQGAVNSYFLPFIQHEIDQGEIDPKINARLLNFMLVSLGQYLVALYDGRGPEVLTPQLIDGVVDDLEYILTNGIFL